MENLTIQKLDKIIETYKESQKKVLKELEELTQDKETYKNLDPIYSWDLKEELKHITEKVRNLSVLGLFLENIKKEYEKEFNNGF